ncbi:hypothetical protein MUP46_01030 [Patescibacteria group bacterium]|nr:hypothetical protein [Patescibacteria group bacterium]
MADNGSCAWPKCKKTGKDWLEGKCYCAEHYDMATAVINDKPVGKAAIGAGTVIINE